MLKTIVKASLVVLIPPFMACHLIKNNKNIKEYCPIYKSKNEKLTDKTKKTKPRIFYM